jgi:hypothetical protein
MPPSRRERLEQRKREKEAEVQEKKGQQYSSVVKPLDDDVDVRDISVLLRNIPINVDYLCVRRTLRGIPINVFVSRTNDNANQISIKH